MRTSRIRIRVRAAFAASLLVLLSGLAPAAAQPLATIQGSSIVYRVDVPVGWQTSGGDGTLTVGRGDVAIMVSATDLVPVQETAPASVADRRRYFTEGFMGSDTLAFGLITGVMSRTGPLEQDGRMLEIRMLGGQRAAFIQGRMQRRAGWVSQAYLTVKDGIMYLLVFGAPARNLEKHQDLFDRVHQSFVLAEAPPS